mmetsp:Transcript_31358/g.100047  ORF Transcript_31358/g.100047 Transcript_31358/m.100047 type:complete len:223 (-) Transcript_31358:384-1052(-)
MRSSSCRAQTCPQPSAARWPLAGSGTSPRTPGPGGGRPCAPRPRGSPSPMGTAARTTPASLSSSPRPPRRCPSTRLATTTRRLPSAWRCGSWREWGGRRCWAPSTWPRGPAGTGGTLLRRCLHPLSSIAWRPTPSSRRCSPPAQGGVRGGDSPSLQACHPARRGMLCTPRSRNTGSWKQASTPLSLPRALRGRRRGCWERTPRSSWRTSFSQHTSGGLCRGT